MPAYFDQTYRSPKRPSLPNVQVPKRFSQVPQKRPSPTKRAGDGGGDVVVGPHALKPSTNMHFAPGIKFQELPEIEEWNWNEGYERGSTLVAAMVSENGKSCTLNFRYSAQSQPTGAKLPGGSGAASPLDTTCSFPTLISSLDDL